MGKNKFQATGDMKFGLIGEEDTIVGFLMAGVGQFDGRGRRNYKIVDSKTTKDEVESFFKELTTRGDIGIILINQHVADMIRHVVDAHTAILPTILEIPTKDKPYEASRDSVMQRIKVFFGGNIDGA